MHVSSIEPGSRFTRWFRSQDKAKQISLYFLALIIGVLLTIGGYNLMRILGPATVKLEAIPYGISPQTAVRVGQKAQFPDHPERLAPPTQQELQKAKDFAMAGAWAQASEIYEALLVQHPRLAPALYGATYSLLQLDSLTQERLTSAEAYLTVFEKLSPQNAYTDLIKSLYSERVGQKLEALEQARRARDRTPSLPEARLRLAQLLLAAGQPSQADHEIRTGITLSKGSDSRYYAVLAQIMHQTGELDSCSSVVEYALSKFPTATDLLLLRGHLQEYAGKFEQAEQTYQRILLQSPHHRATLVALATLGEKAPPGEQSGKGQRLSPRDRVQVALDILEPLVLAYPENLPLREALGQALLKGRLFDRARTQFQEIQTQDPDYPDIQLRIQEASAVTLTPYTEQSLSQNLKKSVDSLRHQEKSHSDQTLLGHYLVRYGASPKEFFARYAPSRFVRIDSLTWQERFAQPPLLHQYTVYFDSKGFYGVHVLVKDTSYRQPLRHRGQDLFGKMVQTNGRISGIGTATGLSDCEGLTFEGAIWETRDNFELLVRFESRPAEARMVRLDPRKKPEDPRLCSYLPYINRY